MRLRLVAGAAAALFLALAALSGRASMPLGEAPAARSKRGMVSAATRESIEAGARVLESVSHRAVLERGFALVRDAKGAVRRRAGSIAPGESLTLTFVDGEARVVEAAADAKSKPAPKRKQGVDQGSLF